LSVKCKSCESSNVRLSQKSSALASIYRSMGMLRYRCRDCRRSFYALSASAVDAPAKRSEEVRRKRTSGWRHLIQRRSQRRTIEVILFIAMLLIFYFAFNTLVSKDGSGIFSHPAQVDP
jgi:transposase-like protein